MAQGRAAVLVQVIRCAGARALAEDEAAELFESNNFLDSGQQFQYPPRARRQLVIRRVRQRDERRHDLRLAHGDAMLRRERLEREAYLHLEPRARCREQPAEHL